MPIAIEYSAAALALYPKAMENVLAAVPLPITVELTPIATPLPITVPPLEPPLTTYLPSAACCVSTVVEPLRQFGSSTSCGGLPVAVPVRINRLEASICMTVAVPPEAVACCQSHPAEVALVNKLSVAGEPAL